MNDILLIDIERLLSISTIDKNSARDDVRAVVKYVQDEIVEHVIGTRLFDKLKELIATHALARPENGIYKTLLDDYIAYIFAWRVPAELSIVKSIKVRNVGTIQTINDQTAQMSLDEIKYYNDLNKNKADLYIAKTEKFLLANYDLLPELRGCTCRWNTFDAQPLSKSIHTTLNLTKTETKPRL